MTTEGETLVGRYRITRRLGRGGMAEVWQAHDAVLRREVAIKIFHLGGSDTDARRAAAEMHTLAALSHPNLVAVHDAGTDADADRTFLVMELVAGPTLAERLAGPTAVDAPEAAAIARDVAAGLAHVHRRGITHRDVKPANILLPSRDHDDGPVAKLADLGIAQHAGQDRLTQTGMTIGTARYLAPEQVTGRTVGPAADVYALGLVLLETLGATPGWDGTPVEIAMARLTTPPVVPGPLGPVWAPLLTAMTAVDPAARPTADAVRDALLTAPSAPTSAILPGRSAPTTVLPAAVDTPAPGRRRVTVAVTVASLLVASGVVAGVVLTHRGAGPVVPGGAVTAPAASGPTASGSTSTPAVPAVAPSTAAAPTTVATIAATSTPAASATPTPPSPAPPTGQATAPVDRKHTPPGKTRSRTKGGPGG